MPVIQLANTRMWYDECGQGEPLVALHPGGAGVDSRALAPSVAALAGHFHGAAHYEVVVAKLAALHAREPAYTRADLAQVTGRTLVMVADDDEVRLEHAVDLYRSLPDAELAVIPGTSHGLLVEKPELCNLVITEFLTKDPVPTFAPVRRGNHPVSPGHGQDEPG